MPGPLETSYYNKRIIRYSRVLGGILSDLQVFTEGKTVRVPMEYLGGLRDQSLPTYQAGTLPVATLKFSGFEVDPEKVLNRNIKVNYSGAIQRQRVPVLLDYEFCIRTKKQTEMFQIIEQILGEFYPTFDVLVSNSDLNDIKENLKIIPSSYDFADSFEGTGDEPNFYDLTFMFRIQGAYFYSRTLNDGDGGGVIHEVNISLGIGDTYSETEQLQWVSEIDNFDTVTRLWANEPLNPEEGVYHYDGDQDPEVLQVIASGDWVREGYEQP